MSPYFMCLQDKQTQCVTEHLQNNSELEMRDLLLQTNMQKKKKIQYLELKHLPALTFTLV